MNKSHMLTGTNSKKMLVTIILGIAIIAGVRCVDNANRTGEVLAADYTPIVFTSIIPTDIANPADPQQAAEFAWKEFIAVTWPVKVNPNPGPGLSGYFRGQASTTDSSGSTGAGGLTVFETFYHRNELYPTYASGVGNVLPNPDTIPSYFYGGGVSITKATPNTSLNLFNNLDEASEITLANMYFTPLAERAAALQASYPNPTPAQQQQITAAGVRAGILYEAKANPVIYNYIKDSGFNNSVPRRHARTQALNKILNQPVNGTAFELPTGSVEIKATWRHYDPDTDDLNNFHWTIGIYYTNVNSALVANNDTLLLISLHIIQKTPNVPTFTFATFEHVTNEKNGFRFINTNPLTDTASNLPRPLPDSGMITAIRQFPIPGAGSAFDLVTYNKNVQSQVRSHFGNNNVWANYQLIGVQAVVTNDPTATVPPQQFFLSNFATETNDALQFFQGGLSGPFTNVPNPDAAHVFVFNKDSSKYIGFTSGGCLGCHGSQGQFQGGDFSVIAATGNAFIPEPVRPYPGGKVVNQNPQGFPLPHMAAAAVRK